MAIMATMARVEAACADADAGATGAGAGAGLNVESIRLLASLLPCRRSCTREMSSNGRYDGSDNGVDCEPVSLVPLPQSHTDTYCALSVC
jgi:hypothetical protein